MKPLLATLTLSLAVALSSQAQTLWEGDDSNLFGVPSNWTSGVPNVSGTNEGTIDGTGSTDPRLGTLNGAFQIISANVTQTGHTVGVNGTDNSTNGAVTLNGTWNLNGGTFDVDSNYEVRLNGTFIVDGGTLAGTGTGGYVVNTPSTDVQFLSGTHDVGSSKFNIFDGNVLIDNASLSAGSMWMGSFSGSNRTPVLTLQDGANLDINGQFRRIVNPSTTSTTVSFASGVSTFSADSWFTGGGAALELDLDFATASSGSTFTIASGFFTEAEWQTQFTNGKLTVDGDNTGKAFADYFQVSGDTLTFVPIPEPGSAALLGMALGGVLLFGRRRRS